MSLPPTSPSGLRGASFALTVVGAKDGGLGGNRTPDLCNANAALYQLSYKPVLLAILP